MKYVVWIKQMIGLDARNLMLDTILDMARTKNRPTLMLECTVCKEHNYATSKNIKEQKERLELNKFCNTCNKYQPHKETK